MQEATCLVRSCQGREKWSKKETSRLPGRRRLVPLPCGVPLEGQAEADRNHLELRDTTTRVGEVVATEDVVVASLHERSDWSGLELDAHTSVQTEFRRAATREIEIVGRSGDLEVVDAETTEHVELRRAFFFQAEDGI